MNEIVPAILPRDASDLREKVSALPAEIPLFHFDVLEQEVWSLGLNKSFEAHLMVEEPEKIIDTWINRGAKRVIVHKINTEFVGKYKDKVELGIGVELQMPLSDIFYLVPKVSFVHLMSIAHIGEQGHPFDARIFDRIIELRKEFPEVVISVDGGIDKDNYKYLAEVGINRLVVGSHFQDLWNSLTKK
jgi:pentose-5-phosphate-3-epimerase